MTLTTQDDALVIEDRPPARFWIGPVVVLFGLALAVLPWLALPDLPGRRVVVAVAGLSLLGLFAIAFGIYQFTRHPVTRAEFRRSQRRVIVTCWTLAVKRREIPFQAIEVMTVGQKMTPDGQLIYRIAVGTRSGERIPLSRWRPEKDGMYEAVREIEKWLRD